MVNTIKDYGTKEIYLIKFLPIILICNINLKDCNEETASTRTYGEVKNTPISCIIEGHTRAAGLAFAPKEGEQFYVKIKCVPKENE